MYLGTPCYSYALNCHVVYLAIPKTRPLCMKKQMGLFYLYATTKSEIQICSNKHETGLVDLDISYEISTSGQAFEYCPLFDLTNF